MSVVSNILDRLKAFLRRFRRLIAGVVIFCVLFTLFGVFLGPPLVTPYLLKELSKDLIREVTVQKVRVYPWRLAVGLHGIAFRERGSGALLASFDELFVNLQSISPLKGAIVLGELKAVRPYVHIVRNPDFTYNFSDIVELLRTKPGPPWKYRFSVRNIRVIDGSADFEDRPTGKRHAVTELNVAIPFVSNIPEYAESSLEPSFSAKINGTAYVARGKTKPFADSLDSSFEINLADLDIPFYVAYLPVKPRFIVRSGRLDAKTTVTFVRSGAGAGKLTVAGDVTVRELALDEMTGRQILKLPRIDVSMSASEPLLQKIALSRMNVTSPEITVERRREGTYSFGPLLSLAKVAPREADKNDTEVSLDVAELQLTGGRVTLRDLMPPKPFTSVLYPVDITARSLSTAKDARSGFSLRAATDANEGFTLEGELSLDPLAVEGTCTVTSLFLPRYAPYAGDFLAVDLVDGRLDISTRFRFAGTPKEPAISLSELSASLAGLRARKTGESTEFLKIPGASVKGAHIDLAKKEARVEDVSSEKGTLFVQRSGDGVINLMSLVKPAEETASGMQGVVPGRQPQDWKITLGRLSITGYMVRLQDEMPAEPVNMTLSNVRLQGENLSTDKKAKGTLSLATVVNGKGTLSASGTVQLEPVAANMRLALRNVDLSPLAPYLTDVVAIGVTSGALSAAGNVQVGLTPGKGLTAAYTGDLSVTGFASVDQAHGDDFLAWKSLALSRLNVGYNPLRLAVKGAALTDFRARVVIAEDGTLNLLSIFEEGLGGQATPSETAGAAPAKTGPAPEHMAGDIRIDTITLQGGRVDFSDRYIKPSYSATLTDLGGRISGLSTDENAVADVNIQGKLNEAVPLEITGKINPLKADAFVDLVARFKDLDLGGMTPYSGKYAGYAIEKGKLSLDVKYLIVGRKLESQNKIFLDQFTFGEQVESPAATKLPVRLAVALLKDRKGQINLDIPVSGSLDDPSFSYGSIILKILLNLLVKAATSPFSLLGALFGGGGGEDLGYAEFDYGSSTLSDTAQKKVATLAKALQDRPALRLEMSGFVDKEQDREGLVKARFERKLKAQKFLERSRRGQTEPPVEALIIEPAEYEKYLRAAYKEEKFPKPRNVVGLSKDLPANEMEKLMLTHIQVTDDDLVVLAQVRAQNVRDAIVRTGQVEQDRIFLVKSDSLTPGKTQNVKDSRVDFRLK